MRVLLDECIDRRLAPEFVGHEVRTVPDMGWAAIKNSELLALAERNFEAFVTVDRNLAFQQNLTRFSIAVGDPRRRLSLRFGSLPGEGQARAVSVCHCTDCQRRTGSAFAVVAHFKDENLEISGGPFSTYEYRWRSLDGLSARC